MSANSNIRRPAAGEPLRVLVVAEDPLIRETLTLTLSRERTVRIVDRAEEAHVALLDTGAASMPEDRPGRARFELVLTTVTALDIPSVVLAEGESHARAALARGARGAVGRKPDGPRLVAALSAVSTGLTVLDFSLAPTTSSEDEPPLSLTGREQQVLELLAAGFSNRRIAKRLGISEHTAKFHVNGILVKLSAGTRTEAVVTAARRGLVVL